MFIFSTDLGNLMSVHPELPHSSPVLPRFLYPCVLSPFSRSVPFWSFWFIIVRVLSFSHV